MSGKCQLTLRRSKVRNAVVPDRRLVLVLKRTNGGSRWGPCGACLICAPFTSIEIEELEDINPLLVPLPEAVVPFAQCLDDEKPHDIEQAEIATATARGKTHDGTANFDADRDCGAPGSALLPDALTAALMLRTTLSVAHSITTMESGGVDEHGTAASPPDVGTDARTETTAHAINAPFFVAPPMHYRRRNVHNESDGSRWLSETVLIIKDYLIGQPWLPALPNYIRRLLACRKREGCEAARGFIESLINTGDWVEEEDSNFETESDKSVWYGRDVDTIRDYLNDDPDMPTLSDDIRMLLSTRANEGCRVAEIFVEDLMYNDDWEESVVERGSWIDIRQSWGSARRRVPS